MIEMNRFWKKVNKTKTCWLWEGTVTVYGGGIFWTGKQNMSSRKYAYQIVKGKIPYRPLGSTCGNNLCVNPDHCIDRYFK